MAQTTSDVITNRARLGGLMIALACILSIAAFSTYFFGVPQPASGETTQQTADRYVRAEGPITAAGWMGMFADALFVVGGLFLVMRPLQTPRNFPASAFWTFIVLGGVVYLGLDAILAMGLIPIAQNYAANAILFQIVDDTSTILFGMATLAIGLGAIAIMYGEARAADAAIPAWAAYVGIVGGVATVVGSLGPILGVAALGLALFGIYLVFLPILFLGVRVAMPTLGAVRAAPKAKGQKA